MSKRELFIILAAVTLSCLTGACASIETDLWPRDSGTAKGAPVVFIHPLSNVYAEATLGILPFQVPVGVDPDKGSGVAEIFKDVFLGKQVFKRVRRLADAYDTTPEAVAIGRRQGVDLVLAGRVNYAIPGTELGGAGVDISIRVVNVASGNTVWYVEQTMEQPMDYPETDFLSRLQEALSAPEIRESRAGSVVPNLMVKIAADMADVLRGARYVAKN